MSPPGVCCNAQNVYDPTIGRYIRFPKFSVGFVAASVVFSFVLTPLFSSLFEGNGLNLVESSVIKAVTNPLRGWFFCLAFVSIGLDAGGIVKNAGDAEGNIRRGILHQLSLQTRFHQLDGDGLCDFLDECHLVVIKSVNILYEFHCLSWCFLCWFCGR